MDIILLMSDNSIVIDDNIDKYQYDISYILVKVDEQLNTYVLLEPNKYLFDIKNVTISYEMVITHHDMIDEYKFYSIPFSKQELKVNSFLEMIRTLYSLNRICIVNYVLEKNDSPFKDEIQFCYFKLKILNNEGRVIYKYILDGDKEGKKMDATTIISDIENVYSLKREKNFLVIDTNNEKWNFSKKLKNNVCGIHLIDSRSYSFYEGNKLKFLFERIESFYSQIYIYDKSSIDIMEIDELHDLYDEIGKYVYTEYSSYKYSNIVSIVSFWGCTISSILEYVTYSPYIFLSIQIIKEILDTGKYEEKYTVRSYDEVLPKKSNGKDTIPGFECTTEKPLLLEDLINACKEGE